MMFLLQAYLVVHGCHVTWLWWLKMVVAYSGCQQWQTLTN